MDGSDTRRGLPCWYKNDDVQLRAINDAVFVQHCPYLLLNKYFTKHYFHLPALNWLNKMTVITTTGQIMDLFCLLNGKPRFDAFTMDRVRLIARYKGAYPEFISPVLLALKFAKPNYVNTYKQAKLVLCELGHYFGAQNDILDCYGDPLITGKVGTDIRDGKCTWLIAKALEKATDNQMQMLKRYYGRPDFQSDLKIKSVYEQLNILEDFLAYEEESYNQICKLIKEMPEEFPQDYFLKFVNALYGRNVFMSP
ncbi:hypothetical protein ILUMI_23702 [Ignelater luminosus]|uniref:Farnesyl pyrophosphate synthase n=1 Tax=Ignelater luminosus TaxID=2038154 RepID=A0A8K0FZF1_IGNLU|nr:hypothetical protein ILUMI_23702 [Ignelater luminosus]